jgi:hypothetical protein
MALVIYQAQPPCFLVPSSNIVVDRKPIQLDAICVFTGWSMEVIITSPIDMVYIEAIITLSDMQSLDTEMVVPIRKTLGTIHGNKIESHLSAKGELVCTMVPGDLYTEENPTVRMQLPDEMVKFIQEQ